MARSVPRLIAGIAAVIFTLALAGAVTSQLMLMSVLDTDRAEQAADQIAQSRFTADIVAQTVTRAVAPVAGPDVAAQLATAASTDPRVASTVSAALLDAHRQVVDREPGPPVTGNADVNTAIARSVLDGAVAAGVDLAAVGLGGVTADDLSLEAAAAGAELPSFVPDDVPVLGLRQIAETTRVLALLVVFVAGAVAVVAPPRPGRGLAELGVSTMLVCAVWLGGLLLGGWVIGLIDATLFGEMLDQVWSDAVPSMLLLTLAGVVIGVGLWFGGLALDGFARSRRPPPGIRY